MSSPADVSRAESSAFAQLTGPCDLPKWNEPVTPESVSLTAVVILAQHTRNHRHSTGDANLAVRCDCHDDGGGSVTSLFNGVPIFIPTVLLAQFACLGALILSYLLLHHRAKHP